MIDDRTRIPVVDSFTVERIARHMWEADIDADPMFQGSWEFVKDDYRRRAEVACEVLAGRLR